MVFISILVKKIMYIHTKICDVFILAIILLFKDLKHHRDSDTSLCLS